MVDLEQVEVEEVAVTEGIPLTSFLISFWMNPDRSGSLVSILCILANRKVTATPFAKTLDKHTTYPPLFH